jgi:citrate lyase alpha subunit
VGLSLRKVGVIVESCDQHNHEVESTVDLDLAAFEGHSSGLPGQAKCGSMTLCQSSAVSLTTGVVHYPEYPAWMDADSRRLRTVVGVDGYR